MQVDTRCKNWTTSIHDLETLNILEANLAALPAGSSCVVVLDDTKGWAGAWTWLSAVTEAALKDQVNLEVVGSDGKPNGYRFRLMSLLDEARDPWELRLGASVDGHMGMNWMPTAGKHERILYG